MPPSATLLAALALLGATVLAGCTTPEESTPDDAGDFLVQSEQFVNPVVAPGTPERFTVYVTAGTTAISVALTLTSPQDAFNASDGGAAGGPPTFTVRFLKPDETVIKEESMEVTDGGVTMDVRADGTWVEAFLRETANPESTGAFVEFTAEGAPVQAAGWIRGEGTGNVPASGQGTDPATRNGTGDVGTGGSGDTTDEAYGD